MMIRSPGRGSRHLGDAQVEPRRLRPEPRAAELGDRIGPPGDDADGDRLPRRRLVDRVAPEVRIGEQPVDEAGEGGHRLEAAVEPHPADDLVGAGADGEHRDADERVARGDVGHPLRGVVPVDLGAGGPGLARDLGEVDDAGELGLDLGAGERIVAGDAEDRADEQAGAGDDVVGSGSVIAWPGWM